ncbi:MAG: NADPH-dependent F420 reductase [Pseudomonadota bacterium]
MNITILGTGRMGAAFGRRLGSLGHSITYGTRRADDPEIAELVSRSGDTATASDCSSAVAAADLVIVAVPYHALAETIAAAGSLEGKTVVDVTNALAPTDDGLMHLSSDTSSAEELQNLAPNAMLVKAFNTVGFHIIANPALAGGPVTVMLAGDDADAKRSIAEFVGTLGFEAADVGPLRHARYLEGMSALYLVPYLTGRSDDAFEYYLRTGASPTESKGVRAAG